MAERYQKETEKLSKDLPVLQEIANSAWKKEEQLKELKTELSALDRKIQLSLKPIDESEEKPDEKQGKGEQQQQNHRPQPYQLPERLQEVKEAMGERLVVGFVPKYSNEKQLKGVKL